MPTRTELKNKIMSHPNNNLKRWKIEKFTKEELQNLYNNMVNSSKTVDNPDSNPKNLDETNEEYNSLSNEGKDAYDELYNELQSIENDLTIEEDAADEMDHVEGVSDKLDGDIDDVYGNEMDDDVDVDEDVDDDTISLAQLKKEIIKLKKYFRSSITKRIYKKEPIRLINRVSDDLNDLLDRCLECSKRDEENFLDDIDHFVSKYVDENDKVCL